MKTSSIYFILMVISVLLLGYLYGIFAAFVGIQIWVFSVGNVAHYLKEEGKYDG